MPSNQPIVETANGSLRGATNDGIAVFKGIRYGAPTGGANRFRPPRPVEPWTGVRDADAFAQTAPQQFSFLALGGTKGNRPTIGEDCLGLNVWTPGCDDARRPVMVWFHGGGFEAGTGSMELYGGDRLARRGDVVVVTVNHRLGVLGHLHLDHLLDDVAGSANVGFLDLAAALEWVRDNIAGFGGDPGNVTIFGQSGGGRKVSLSMAARRTEGLFARGIVQSGSHLRLIETERAADNADRFVAKLGLAKLGRDGARALVDLPMDDLLAAAGRAWGRFAPAIDGVLFDDHPWSPHAPAWSADLPMLVGTCRTEQSGLLPLGESALLDLSEEDLDRRLGDWFSSDDVPALVELIRDERPDASAAEVFFTLTTDRSYWLDSLLQLEAKVGQRAGPAWSYQVTWRTPVDGGRTFSPHSLDLPFVFDNVAVAADQVGEPTPETAAMAETMSETWLAFARTGDPNHAGIPRWPTYDLDRRATLHLDVPPTVVDDPHAAERLAMSRYPTRQAT